MKNVPHLRFKDDNGQDFPEYVKKDLGSLVNVMQSGISRMLSDSDIGFPVIRSNNLIDERVDFSEIKYWHFVDDQGVDLKNFFLKDGDLLVNFINSIAQIGKVALYKNALQRDVIFTTNIMRVSFKDEVKCEFSLFFFQTPIYEKHIQSITKPAVNQASFTTKEFKLLRVPLPSLGEQTKIADFLTAIDDRISQLSQKCDGLAQYKKGLMQKIFSQELRFKDEKGRAFPAWEEKRLGDVSSFFSGGTPLTTNRTFYDGNIPFIKSGEINSSSTAQFITEGGLNNSSAKIVMAGDLLYALYGATSGEVAISKINGAINQAVLCIRSEIDTYFLYSYLFFEKQSILEKYLQGGQGNLSADIIKSLKIPIPSKPEQEKIAGFLSAVDEKISHAQAQRDALKQYKQGLLQQIFV